MLRRERIVLVNQFAAESVQGRKRTMALHPEEVLKLTALALIALDSQGSGWISVEDRLPETMQHCLIHGDYLCQYAWYSDGKFWKDTNEWYQRTPTHWMPLPSPPKEPK